MKYLVLEKQNDKEYIPLHKVRDIQRDDVERVIIIRIVNEIDGEEFECKLYCYLEKIKGFYVADSKELFGGEAIEEKN